MSIKNNYAIVAANKWTILSLLAGLVISIAAAVGVARFNQQQAGEAVNTAAQKSADAVVNRIKLYQYGLRGARGSIQTMGEHGITREGFDRYSKTRNVEVEFPGARGFGFIRRVAPQDEVAFLAQARADGWPDFAIRQLTPHDAERYVIQYISPVEPNRVAIGLDIASEANRRQAARSAMLSGEVRLSGPITLVQGIGQPQQSFLILMPIYRSVVDPSTVDAREAQAFGWSYAALSMDAVLSGIRPPEQAVSLELRDITDPTQGVVFYKSEDEATQDIVLSKTVERDVYGRRWQLQFGVHPLFISQLRQLSPLLVLSLGLIGSVLLAALVGVLSVSRARQLQFIAEQAKLAAIVASSVDGIIGKNLDGTVTSWNGGAERLFGFSAQEALGRRLSELIVPESLKSEEAEILACIEAGKSVPSFNTQRQDKNGTLIPVSVTVSPIRDSAGQVIGASKTVRDNSEQIAAEAKIHELNSSLEAQVVQRTSELNQLNVLLGNVMRSASEVAIIATDREGIIRLFNTGAERILGYTAAELIDKSSPAIFHLNQEVEARSRELTAQYGQTIEGFRVFVHTAELEGAETREWTYVRKNGTYLPVSLAVTAMRDEHGEITGYLGIAVDLTARKASENAFASARDQLLMAADVAELGIWSWILADNSLSWNDRMFELYDQPLSLRDTGLNYEHWHARVHPDDVEMAASKLSMAVEGRGLYDPIFRVVRPDGQVRVVQAGAQVERDSRGVAVRVTGINRDITEQRELESRLLDAKEQADAASASKSSFLANMSHEIRTPMNAVLGMLHLVQNTELDSRQLDYVSKAETAAKSLLGLLNDILDYSKIDAGKLQLDLHTFELETLMRDLAVVLSGNQGHKDVEVMFDLDPQLPSALLGDSLRLQQVLINLAGNALKFTRYGQVVVRIEALQRLGEEVSVRIEVTDTGIGINADHLTRIFDGFTQAEASTTRRFGGTGLGLVISKRLINLMGGELQVSSEVGVGSRFWFDIELGVSHPLPLRAFCPGVDRPMRLLVADDNEVAGYLLARMVEALGWQVDLVNDGLQAVERVEQMQREGKAYDVILMDWRMPDMDGLSAARLIRQRSQGLSMPLVIMITAYGREVLADAQQEDDAPFAGFLSKPVTPQQLADTIQRVSMGEVAPQPSVASQRAAQPKRLSGMHLLVVEDNMLNRQVAFELLKGEGAQVTLAEGGLDGVQLVTDNAQTLDAVLMDVQMPDIDGLEATRRIRADARNQGLKIIAMTANASSADEQACRAAGMDDHLGKPIDLEKMVATLLRHAGREDVAPVTQPPAQPHDSAVESAASINQRFGGNHQLIRNVLSSFAPEQAKQLARLQEQVEQRNAAGAAAVLHAIKGSSGTMGAWAISQLAGELEQQLLHGDDASKAQVLADGGFVEALRELLHTSDQALKAMFELPTELPSAEINPAVFSLEQWREALGDILALLETGNMQAIVQSEALLAQTPQALRPQFGKFLDSVQSLDFAASLLAGHELLNSV
ncbi:PAS domain-containing hybrid sensor histidine kinase/response regulator [Pseudomonas sp. EA_35y_Pfl2_R111]|uniref:PAS domain-containing hybrid sensor histidine kinase/response regulator n=1 Tax=Pseudomonas sp. EA_35y_Pfl2_R111 TaxID=3088689 RepID=UPI0030D74CDD